MHGILAGAAFLATRIHGISLLAILLNTHKQSEIEKPSYPIRILRLTCAVDQTLRVGEPIPLLAASQWPHYPKTGDIRYGYKG